MGMAMIIGERGEHQSSISSSGDWTRSMEEGPREGSDEVGKRTWLEVWQMKFLHRSRGTRSVESFVIHRRI
jgi:hypothetical protein